MAYGTARPQLFRIPLNFWGFAVACIGLLCLLGTPVRAQAVLATVNNIPVTNFDVAQRIRIVSLTERRRLDQRSALQELIDDQVKLIEARRIGYRITEDGVEAELLKMAKSNRQTLAEFNVSLRRAGIEPANLRDKIRAELAWTILLRDQGRKGSQVSNEEIEKAVQEEQRKQKDVIDYQLQSVIFVVPSGTNPGERERAANAARGRFTSCETGFDELRMMRDVAVRTPSIRSTETMTPQLVALLANTPTGLLTPAFRCEQGIEMVAVCERKSRKGEANVRSEVTVNLSEKRMMDNAKGYLEKLRKTVDIKRKG